MREMSEKGKLIIFSPIAVEVNEDEVDSRHAQYEEDPLHAHVPALFVQASRMAQTEAKLPLSLLIRWNLANHVPGILTP